MDAGRHVVTHQPERENVDCATNAIGSPHPRVPVSIGETSMFVTVIHHIHDPEGFQAAEAKALEAGLPSYVALPIHAATDDHTLGLCIWEGESVDAVREVVEGAVGAWSNNEYHAMHVDGLTPQLG